MTAPRALGIVAVALVGAVACRPKDDAFYAKVFSCESNASDTCGTTRDGSPMTCVAATQLGGTDFCTGRCDPAQGSPDPRFVCTSSGALLQTCSPILGATNPAFGCPAGLSCYRTDVLADDGLCIQMPVCSKDTDCGALRPACAATLLKKRTSLPIFADNLQCLQTDCGAGKTDCPPGDACLAAYYDGVDTYDICVPTCDGSKQCPPNFTCAFSPAASGSPSLCLPGVAGIRCHDSQDCIVGDCVDTGAGFNECIITVLPCQTNLDCAVLNGASATFVCVEGVPGTGKHCVMRQTFSGTNCADVTDCPAGFMCTDYSPYAPSMSHGECRLPCGEDLGCPVRGGIPHVCLAGGAGGCFPTGFGLPCAKADDCLAELACLPVLPDAPTLIDSPTICTMTCATDADCAANPFITNYSYCRQDEHLCRLTGFLGARCEANNQCHPGSTCTIDGNGAGTCTR
jgi:hypothetical protein